MNDIVLAILELMPVRVAAISYAQLESMTASCVDKCTRSPHARTTHDRQHYDRVLYVDLDVHHGDGVEEVHGNIQRTALA